jgi:hypothetical protein
MSRFLLIVVAMVALFSGTPAPAALRRTAPVAGSAVTARWWQRVVKIVYPGGRWEYAFQRWYGMPDSPVNVVYHQGGLTGQPISWTSLIGATITVLGETSPYVP